MLSRDRGSANEAFTDLVFLLLFGFIAIVMLIIPWVNPPTEEEETAPAGQLFFDIAWDDALDVDIDLWVLAPSDRPVGYSNKGSKWVNLLRDDLGHKSDPLPVNAETTVVRSLRDGEYAANVHYYSPHQDPVPEVEVTLVVRQREDSGSMTILLVRKVTLLRPGQEITMVRFKMAGEKLRPETVGNAQCAMRSAGVGMMGREAVPKCSF